MDIPFREYHLVQLLEEWESSNLPLDRFFNQYVRAHKSLGSKDRREIAAAAFGIVRWKLLFKEGSSIGEQYRRWKEIDPLGYRGRDDLPWHVRCSFPEELFELVVKRLGLEKAVDFAYWSNGEAPLTIRANPAKIDRDELVGRLKGARATADSPWGIEFEQRRNLMHLSEFKEGLFEIQDEASQLIAALAEVKRGDQVLDYCAGSGGKALAIAHRLGGKGQLYLHDVRRRPLLEARKRLARAGVQNSQIVQGDLRGLKKKMDWVIVDVPCSGTGTFRRNVDLKWKLSRRGIEEFVGRQRAIFERALSFVKTGGKILYATCSLLPEENMEQIDHFLRTYSLRQVGEPFCSPWLGSMDGMFAAVMER